MRSVRYGLHAARAPTRRRRAGRACPRSRSRRRGGRSRARGRRGAAVRTSSSPSPSCAPASAASSATAREWPSVYGDLRSTKLAIASSAASKRSPDEHDGERGLGRDHRVPGPRRRRGPRGSRRPRAHERAASAGSNCLPRALARQRRRAPRRRRCGGRPRRTPPAARAARRAAPRRPRARPASPGRPTARRTRRARRGPSSGSPSCSPSDRAIARVVGDHPVDLAVARERELQPDAGSGAAAGARRRAGACPRPPPRRLRSSWSYLPAFSAMSSPNHFACSWASVWQPTLTSSAV